MRSTPPTLAEHLQRQHTQLGGLLGRVSRIAAADSVLRQALGSPLGHRVRLGNLRNKTAVIYADSGTTATILRFRKHELLDILIAKAGVNCERVLVKIDPSLTKL